MSVPNPSLTLRQISGQTDKHILYEELDHANKIITRQLRKIADKPTYRKL